MPLSEHHRMVTRSLKDLRYRLLSAVEDVEYRRSIQMRILSGEHGCPAWCADGVANKRALKADAFGAYLIQVRRLIDPGAITGQGMRGVIVCHDEQNVRPISGLNECLREQTKGECHWPEGEEPFHREIYWLTNPDRAPIWNACKSLDSGLDLLRKDRPRVPEKSVCVISLAISLFQ